MLALLLAQIIQVSIPIDSAGPQNRLPHACFDLSNAVFSDRELYTAISGNASVGGGLPAADMDLVRQKIISYASMLGVEPVAFEIEGGERYAFGFPLIRETERCCFPVPSNATGKTVIACLEVGE